MRPFPVVGGSSISHYDTVASRNLLMEPAINPDLTHFLKAPYDLTFELFNDIGWKFPDADGDGVVDDEDCNPNSNRSATIVIGGNDTGVPNQLFAQRLHDGRHDRARCRPDAKNHGELRLRVGRTDQLLGKQATCIDRCPEGRRAERRRTHQRAVVVASHRTGRTGRHPQGVAPLSFEAGIGRGRLRLRMSPSCILRLFAAGTALLVVASLSFASAQPGQPRSGAAVRDQVRSYRQAHERAILEELRQLVALPNVARDAEDIAKNAALLRQMLERRGFTTQTPDGPRGAAGRLRRALRSPARRAPSSSTRTTTASRSPRGWKTPPWTPVLRAGTLEAGAAEVPWDALPARDSRRVAPLRPRRPRTTRARSSRSSRASMPCGPLALPPSVNLKFFFEGEEEAARRTSSGCSAPIAETLRADAWIFCDGPVHQSRAPLVSFGVRGAIDLELTIYGPIRAVHSGHYGNWAPNPAAALAHLLASMRDADGRILIAGFDDDVRPLSAAERAAIDAAPAEDDAIAQALALGRREAVRAR